MKKSLIAATIGSIGLVATSLVQLPAQASTAAVTDGLLTWNISECAFSGAFVTPANSATDSCKSIRETQVTAGNVAKGSTGWTFSSGTGTREDDGTLSLDFTGRVQLGNTNLGNYSIALVDPHVNVTSEGTGSIQAKVAVKNPGASNETFVTDSETDQPRLVTIVDLPSVPGTAKFDATPAWDGVGEPNATAPLDGKQFNPDFVNALPASMQNWFRASSSAAATASRGDYNPLKAPGVVTVDARSWNPTVTVTGAEGLTTKGTQEITVNGSGFNPNKQGGAVAGLYVVFGPNPNEVTNGFTDSEIYGAAAYLPAGPDADGNFSTKLTVSGKYTDSHSTVWDGSKTQLGVSTWAAHTRATTAWDSFTGIDVAAAPESSPTPTTPTPTPGPSKGVVLKKPSKVTKVTVGKYKKAKKTVKVSWSAPAKAKDRAPVTRYLIRVSKANKSSKFGKWIVVKSPSRTIASLSKTKAYWVQIVADSSAGRSPVVKVKLKSKG